MSTVHTGTMGVNGMTSKRPAPNWTDLRKALWERSQGLCEVSGRPLYREGFDAHHRRNKGMGGTSRLDTDTLPNLLALDPMIHNGGPRSVHGARISSDRFGWLVPKNINSVSSRPVLLATSMKVRRWALLGDKGGRLWLSRPLSFEEVLAEDDAALMPEVTVDFVARAVEAFGWESPPR